MNEIKCAVNSIHKILQTPSKHPLSYQDRSQLADILDTLISSINSNSPRKEWTRLICRQLNRLTNYNQLISSRIWIQSHEDVLYLQEETNGEQGMGRSWNHFNTMINFEKEIEHRESRFYLDIKEQKIEQIKINRSVEAEHITNILRCNRWIIILGDPGSAKTSLLQWITRVFAESIINGQERVALEGDDSIPIRIPILIRIGEFAMWLKQYPTKAVIDYIGEHTWDSKRYCHDDYKNVLKALVAHGHTLILLDGLDETTDVREKREIVDLVRKFVDEYVRGPDFISAFDDRMFYGTSLDYRYHQIIETKPPSMPDGNQIIITSRIIGYQVHPLVGTFMCHYAFLLMNYNETKEFVKKWLFEVDKSLFKILLNEGINLDGELVKVLSKRRYNVLKALLKNSSELLSNPSLLSLICKFNFQSFDKFNSKSRVEVYDHAVQVALHSWKNHESKIPERVLIHFWIAVACYLHLNSPSGLIDEYDIKQLCYSTLKQQRISCDHKMLREYVCKLISLVDFNIGIFSERGLQTFGFLHLSFQDYFVAQSLVNGSPDEVAKRIVTITVHPRFHQSLLLAIGWISWKWSSDNYDMFCNLLITLCTQYSIPFGTILFFDALNDIQRLPSNSVIFIALNTLLDHPYYPSRTTYLITSLLKLHENIIIQWMQTQLKDEKRLSNFCQCLLQNAKEPNDKIQTKQKSIPSAVYQQLWLLHNVSESVELIIDQTLRIIMRSATISDQIFNKDLSLYLLSNNISISHTHPLIISVIIAVCDGVCLRDEKGVIKIDFSIKRMHRQSSILKPLIEYISNKNEPHSIKIGKLIKKYECIIQKSLPSDSSSDVVDSFIALICLQGLLQPLIYEKYDKYEGLSLALNRLKRTWFYIKESYKNCLSSNDELHKTSFIQSEVEMIIYESFLQLDQSHEEQISLLIACASAWRKLGIQNQTIWIDTDDSYDNEDNEYFQYQSPFTHVINKQNLDEMINNIDSQQTLHRKLLFLLNILPQSLQQLYYNAIISPTNNINSLSLVMFLSECLLHLEHFEKIDFDIYLALIMLYSLLKEYMLENYALIFYKEKCSQLTSIIDKDCNKLWKMIQHHKLLDPFLINQSDNLAILISVERQRIYEAKESIQSQQKDLRLFAASISLARLLQAQHHCHTYHSKNTFLIDSTESTVIYFTVTNIHDRVLRIFALSFILDMKDPLIFDEEQRDQLQSTMVTELQTLLPQVSLLTGTVLYTRCYTLCSQQMTRVIAEKFNDELLNEQSRIGEAVFIALRQLKNSNLSHCLSEFTKRKHNLSDLLQLNSTIFYHHFNKTTSFISSNNVLLSLMYLFELIFDTEILRMYVRDNQKRDILPLKALKLFWDESSKDGKIMTYKLATSITNNLHMLNKQDLHLIIRDICKCSIIERKALTVIEKWLDYRMNKVLKVFAHYAALQLFIEDSNIPDLIDIINEMFYMDNKFIWESIIEKLINSSLVNSSIVRQILITLHENVHCYSNFSVSISCKEMFALFLDLELKRVISNVHESSKISFNSFLSMIRFCSGDLNFYLVENFRSYLNFQSELENAIKDEYFAFVIKWMNKAITSYSNDDFLIELYKYIITIPDLKQYPLVYKVIVNALNGEYNHFFSENERIFLQNDIITELEKMIYFSYTSSEDVLAVCLLAYGNFLIQYHELEISRNMSDAMKNILTKHLADTSQRLSQREIQALNKRLWYIDHEKDGQIHSVITEEEWQKAHEYITVQRRPKSSIVEPDSGITLSVGWIKKWSKREERFYYFNNNTGDSHCEPPI
ncbi:unnamed protein product [Rotaria sp. Silwood2]|nr:unnamed protein product [Rotaria sp. Silwood2]